MITITSSMLFSLAASEPHLQSPIIEILGRFNGTSAGKTGKRSKSVANENILSPGFPDEAPKMKGTVGHSIGKDGQVIERHAGGKTIAASKEVYDLTAETVLKGRLTRLPDIYEKVRSQLKNKDLYAGEHSVAVCLRLWASSGLIRYGRGTPVSVTCEDFLKETKAAYASLNKTFDLRLAA